MHSEQRLSKQNSYTANILIILYQWKSYCGIIVTRNRGDSAILFRSTHYCLDLANGY